MTASNIRRPMTISSSQPPPPLLQDRISNVRAQLQRVRTRPTTVAWPPKGWKAEYTNDLLSEDGSILARRTEEDESLSNDDGLQKQQQQKQGDMMIVLFQGVENLCQAIDNIRDEEIPGLKNPTAWGPSHFQANQNDMIIDTHHHHQTDHSSGFGLRRSWAMTAAIMAREPPWLSPLLSLYWQTSMRQYEWEWKRRMTESHDETGMLPPLSTTTTSPPWWWNQCDHSSFLANLRKLHWIEPPAWLSQQGQDHLHQTHDHDPEASRSMSRPPVSTGTLTTTLTGGLLHRLVDQVLRDFVLDKVQSWIAGDYETPHFYPSIEKCIIQVIEPWLHDLVVGQGAEKPLARVKPTAAIERGPYPEWTVRLSRLAAHAFCTVRRQEIFDMVADFPDSQPAVLELRHVLGLLTATADISSVDDQGMYLSLCQELRQSLIRRLNHPGAQTSQIIDVYIATVKVLKLLDPSPSSSDRTLRWVAEPVRSYLRGRTDTVRCIIASLTDPQAGAGELYEELRRQDAKPLENVTLDSDDEEEAPDMDWQPPPSLISHPRPGGLSTDDSAVGRSRAGSGGADSDILAMLVSIYGSKELFVNEYRLMLADKLLANLDYDTDKEVHTLELLKLRFGEQSMRNCEVMVKDMHDSKRSNSHITESLRLNASSRARANRPLPDEGVTVDAAMISHVFWPPLQKEPLKHHPRMVKKYDEFGEVYAQLKNPRRLVWMYQLGSVQLELDVMEMTPDGSLVSTTKEFTCSPLQATLIMHFEDKPQWTADDLSNETGIASHVIEKRMTFWVGQRVIKLVATMGSTHYELMSRSHWLDGDQGLEANASMMMDDDGSEGQAVLAAAQQQEEMEVYESYIVGMLTNAGQLPLDRIHNMLKMFVNSNELNYNKTPQQLSMFLQHLCRQEKLECGPDGLYKLYKK